MAQIFCRYCDEPRLLASKHCVQCNTPFCGKHLACHNESIKNHFLIDPSMPPGTWQCPEHKEVLELYCKNDSTTMCRICYKNGKHVGHQVDNLENFANKMKESLGNDIEKLKVKKQEKENRINFLKNDEKTQKRKAGEVTKKVNTQIREIINQLQTLLHKVQSEIARMNSEVPQSVINETNNLEKQKNELERKIVLLEELSKTNNYTFLQRLKEADVTGILDDKDNQIQAAMFEETRISEMLHKELLQFTDGLIKRLIKDDFPKMKRSPITLDIKTAYYKVNVTEESRSASFTTIRQTRDAGPERFRSPHVLSKCSFPSGRHYWEVEVEGTQCSIGVVYNNTDRASQRKDSRIGYNKESWSLGVEGALSVWHDSIKSEVPTDSPVRSFGVFLEYEAGRLSFYQLCDPIRHLHTFIATFTRPLYAAFYVGEDSKFTILH